MTKADQFLWIVQTVMIRNAILLAGDDDRERFDQYRLEVSATGAYMTCDEAIRASTLIPDRMSASEAAHQFIFFMIDNLREGDEAAEKKRAEVPSWFARH